VDEILDKARQAHARGQQIEEKIRVAQMRFVNKSPQEILKETR
jgi:hypothetical protein